ncbi:DUF4235 domain-containing protein [Planosporangium mesophilum]|uniref:Membrane protein n=1 Tax=Planosporangium mesophilum TaxID=689768 RepID=A0A8J3TB66_9ACTN|nr:DUF4235 domain-containing protein [Planosporangium mesophilum]NJC83297.1 DUF4235 domain-containing protein [Planosporangium mesophilum]GII21674.1 membrane protein [Planosporangium mesophilum]
MNKVLYKPLGLAFGVAGGVLAGMVFKQVWKLVAGEEDAPDATSEEYGWAEVLAAAAIQGAIFAVVKAAVDRGGAAGVRKLTGEWPG